MLHTRSMETETLLDATLQVMCLRLGSVNVN